MGPEEEVLPAGSKIMLIPHAALTDLTFTPEGLEAAFATQGEPINTEAVYSMSFTMNDPTPELTELITGIKENTMSAGKWETVPSQLINGDDVIRIPGIEGEHKVRVDSLGRYIEIAHEIRVRFDNAANVDRRERPKPIPAKDGFYLDKDGDMWSIVDGKWYSGHKGAVGNQYSSVENLPHWAPYTRYYRDEEVDQIRKESYARGRAAGAKKYEASKRHNQDLEAIIGRRRDELMNVLTLNAELQGKLDRAELITGVEAGDF